MPALTPREYTKMLMDLLPEGRAWPKFPGTFIYRVMEGLSEELSRLDGRAQQLIIESDPRNSSADELLPDWERVCGLPDECRRETSTVATRRNDVVARLTQNGSINKPFYIQHAAYLGYDITIYEYRPFRAGISCAGDPVCDQPWAYVWEVRAPAVTGVFFVAGGSSAGDALAVYENEALECSITKRKPAETLVLFSYGD
jgi:uncharacterized protein YmfQ (DUF2313 family)